MNSETPVTNPETFLQFIDLASLKSVPRVSRRAGFWQPYAMLKLRMENAAQSAWIVPANGY